MAKSKRVIYDDNILAFAYWLYYAEGNGDFCTVEQALQKFDLLPHRRYQISNIQRDSIIHDWLEGKTCNKLAEMYGLPYMSVYKIIQTFKANNKVGDGMEDYKKQAKEMVQANLIIKNVESGVYGTFQAEVEFFARTGQRKKYDEIKSIAGTKRGREQG